jgi:NDP-sugar pyrophosphorylase family protein
MAGQGKRFRRAGYDTYKPFLPIFGKPMVQYVLDAFPAHVTKRVLADRALLTDDQIDFLRQQPNVVVHFVPSHGLGPAYTIHQAREQLPLDESFFIAYADIHWTWNYAEVERLLDHDGIVFTRRTFHPHLVGNNYSAFCKPSPTDPDRLAEIREKASFTDEWMSEPLSIGTFYVRDGRAMSAALEAMVGADRRVSDEFFPSLLFNDLVAAGKEVRLHDVDFFVHWGVPEQLEDLRHWVHTCRRLAEAPPITEAVNACCMGGAGARLQGYSAVPKAFIPIGDSGTPMFQYVAEHFGCRENHFIVSDAQLGLLQASGVPDDEIVPIGPPTSSQLATLRAASGFLTEQSRFFLTSCDALGLWDREAFAAYLAREQPDAVVFTFRPTLLQERLRGSHTYVESDGPWVTKIHIKHRPDRDVRGLAGFFWFQSGSVFAELDRVPPDPGRELCADHVLKYMVESGARVGAFPVDAYLHPGSPDELREFAFWTRHHRLFAPVPAGALTGD